MSDGQALLELSAAQRRSSEAATATMSSRDDSSVPNRPVSGPPARPAPTTQQDLHRPSKRLKTDHPTTSGGPAAPPKLTWPASRIPVEIFDLIIAHLDRCDIKTLRLVCREFELKVSADYFRNVVVPFRSELYGTISPRDPTRDPARARQSPSAIFSDGMRIFQSFGPHVSRFALSLEIDHDALAQPPVKPLQEVIPSFWGAYRWPHELYNRYSDLEGIENTADEIQGMKEALRCLTKVVNLGLCCDAGLGFLPQQRQGFHRIARPRHPVFSPEEWRYESRPAAGGPSYPCEAAEVATFATATDLSKITTIADFNGIRRPRNRSDDPMELKRTVLEKMASDAGYRGGQADELIHLLLKTEGVDLADIEFSAPLESTEDQEAKARRAANGEMPGVDLDPLLENGYAPVPVPAREPSPDPRRHPGLPLTLTDAQKELLLELGWAQRAMIQSYVIAMIDNSGQGCFSHLTTLTIAMIPSSNVNILCNADLWGAFPSLTDVSVAVVADWRRISKPSPGCVEDAPVSPQSAVGCAYRLLNSYIGRQPRIKKLHFEWICGGEFANGYYQRNQHILPAPFVEDADSLASTSGVKTDPTSLLSLPHVEHLSLKNCWAPPHVFLQTIRQMGLGSLEKLELESVSLSGPPVIELQEPLNIHQTLANALFNGLLPPAPPDPADDPYVGLQEHTVEWMPIGTADEAGAPQTQYYCQRLLPPWYTWAGMLEHFSPNHEIRQGVTGAGCPRHSAQVSWKKNLALSDAFVPEAARLVESEQQYRIKWLSFRSCGYVGVDAHCLESSALLPNNLTSMPHSHAEELNRAVQHLMQLSRDKLMGRIIPYISPEEVDLLCSTFHMTMTWKDVFSRAARAEAMADDVKLPGLGRFSGSLRAAPPSATDHLRDI